MKIEYTVDLDDLAEFTRFHYQSTTWTPRGTIKGGATFLILLSLMFAATGDLNACTFAGILVASIAWTVLSRPIVLWLLRRKAKALYAPGKNKALVGRHSLEISEGALQQRSEGGSDEVHFGAIERVAESPTHVFIYVSALSAHVVPRNKVAQGDLEAFVAQLRSRIAAAVQPNP